jgi:hypothetical protein
MVQFSINTMRQDSSYNATLFRSAVSSKKKNFEAMIEQYADYRSLAGEDAWDLLIAGDGDLRDRLAKAAGEHIHKYSSEVFAKNFVAACQRVVNGEVS